MFKKKWALQFTNYFGTKIIYNMYVVIILLNLYTIKLIIANINEKKKKFQKIVKDLFFYEKLT